MELTAELREVLKKEGAALVGIADMSGVENCGFRAGAAVAVPLPGHIVEDLKTAPTREYHEMYHSLNRKLNGIVSAGEHFLKARGYKALAQTTDRVSVDEHWVSRIPHKTVAVHAGLGWIGKNCLLVTREYGPAVRISSLLTDAPLACDAPLLQSQCGTCRLCVDSCPAQALKGTLWDGRTERADIVDVNRCYRKQVEIMARQTGIETDLCGKCFAVCAYTQNYLKKQKE